ncbi:MAG: imidazolonepropionase [Gemmatimonadota bacterium]|jgi:imidazolonepropionase|nr:MAG: imidazolonepropionase [Gemmatimonadota bacterium]
MRVLRNIGLLATCRADGGQAEIHPLREAALAWEDGQIEWIGPEAQLPARYRDARSFDAAGRLVAPGLVDCHTHLAFAGWRADEFEQRIRGRSYLEIARSGGGILSTVHATRDASEEQLFERCRHFLDDILPLGVTTIECKSGYGLSREQELKLLRVYRALSEAGPARIVPTLLAAHVVPPEYRNDREGYVELVVREIIPQAAAEGLARCCDAFLEESAFTYGEAERILEAGREAGLLPKLHADQLSDGGGARLAATLRAVSADHLEHISDEGIQAIADKGVVAVSLPIATLVTNQHPLPARRLIERGVAVAVATDFNPGTAPSYHLPFALSLACSLQRMTPAEALKGATIHAARAVGLEDQVGSLEPGKVADFAVIDAPSVEQWLYHIRANACVATVIGGQVVAGELATAF